MVLLGVLFLGVFGEWMMTLVFNFLVYHEAYKEFGSPDWGYETVWVVGGAFAFFYAWAVIGILYFQ